MTSLEESSGPLVLPRPIIHDHCKRRGWPLLNAIVVSQLSGMPGERFPEDLSPVEIKVEQGRVFLFDWSEHDKPRPDDFQAASGTS
jgi:hypothetical protein